MDLSTIYSVVYYLQYGPDINVDIIIVSMNTVSINNKSSFAPITSSGVNITTASSITIDKNLIEYIDLLYQLLGVDIDFERWKNMNLTDRINLIRDIKIKKLID
jgi:hypothetical protein